LQDGESGLEDRSSRPVRCPNQTDPQVEDLVEYLRRNLKLGPVMLVAELAEFGITLAASTIHRVLLRRGISRLRDLDITGENMRQPARRYEHPLAGDLVHVDVKKIGRIPDGGGWFAHGKGSDAHRASKRVRRGPVLDPALAPLTDQERRVLSLVGEGMTNRGIAQSMFLAEKTVKNYVSSMLAKLGLQRRTQAAPFGARHLPE